MIKFRKRPGEAALVGTFTICFAIISSSNINFIEPPTILFILGVVLISLYFLFVEPIKQPQSYHNFADKRQFICSCHSLSLSEGIFLPPGNISTNENRSRRGFIIPNFGDVVSNIVIFAGGLFGVILLHIDNTKEEVEDTNRSWQLNTCLPIMFYSTIAISIGSTYYHCNPHDASLVWDRLPMTLAFVSIFCYMLSEYMPNHEGIGESLLLPLLILGLASVLYWRWTDDLRLYALVQFLPLLIIAGLLILYQPNYGGRAQHAFALICYAVAKLCEDRDYEIFNLTHNRISGHSLKHVLAGIASISIASVLL